MAPRARVLAVVAAVAAAAVAAVVGVTWLQTRGETTTAPGAVTHPRSGIPPLLFDFGTRNDAEVQALSRGARLLRTGKKAQAAAIFARYHSLQAQLGAAFAAWPNGSLDAVKQLVAAHPQSPVAQLHLALALYWSGRSADAVKAFQQVDSRFPDSASAVDAEDILYANRFVPGLPYLVLPVQLPDEPTLSAQLDRAKLLARRPSVEGKVAYGVMLWRLDRRVSARRQFDAAAKLAPNDPAVLTADAVSFFTKKNPTAAFGRLGPLTGRFPKAAVVRLHLGLLLIWEKQVQKAVAQLRLAAADAPGSLYGIQAEKLISALVPNGTK
jgi:tetratricopeptide (TPR) repeat protein